MANSLLRPLLFLLFPALWAAETVYVNGTVLTMDPRQPVVQAFAVENGRFTAAGSDAEIRRRAKPSAQVIDLGGRTVAPGFNDAHLHPRPEFDEDSPYAILWLGPDRVRTMEDLIALLKRRAASAPRGQWILGIGYQDTKLGKHPDRRDLDRASTEHPIRINHSSGHISAVNSYVLEKAMIGATAPDPPGGSFDRDPDGAPNGVVRERARSLLSRGLPAPPQAPFAERVKAMQRCLRRYAQGGVTSINAAGVSVEEVALFEAVRDAGAPVRIGLMISEAGFEEARKRGWKTGHGDERLRITAIKSFQGNSMSGRTCWLSEEYSDRPGYFGIPPARGQEEYDGFVRKVHDAGWQLAIHANGDREIDLVLRSIERAQAADPRPNARHRIEHASVCTMSLLERAKAAGVILVFHSYMWEHGDKLEAYGEKRLAMIHPHRTALDLGIHLAGHSDSPVSAADAMLRLQDMVTRQGENGKVYGANQRTTVEEGISVFTRGGAYSTFEEQTKGTIEKGKLADFIVLSRDPRRVPAAEIRHIRVEATYLGGTLVAGQDAARR